MGALWGQHSDLIGVTPLQISTLCGHNEVVDYLIEKGADFDDQGNAAGKACKCSGATDVPVFKCAGCQVVWYCSPECQKKDWKDGGENKHKIQWPRIKEQRELYKEKKKEEVREEVAEKSEEIRMRMLRGSAQKLDELRRDGEEEEPEISKYLREMLQQLMREDGASSSNQR